MNKLAVVTFVLGAAIGGSAGYFVTYKMLDKKYSEKEAENREHYREHYKAKYEAKLNVGLKEQISEKAAKKAENEPNKAILEAKNDVSEYEKVVQTTDYGKYSKNLAKDQELVVKDGPYEVSEDIFEDFLNIDRIDITYFKDDDVFMDMHENVWHEGLERVGDDNLMKILNEGDYEAYIINEDYGEGYHLTIDEGSYEDYMLGVNG